MTKYLVTSALPYINGVKHLGNLVGSMLPADVYARYLRSAGNDVLYICATDEHGTPAELGAQAEGTDITEYCAKMHDVQKEIYKNYDISFDWFGRSSSKQNHELTQHFYHQLDKNDMLEEVETQQVYSKAEERFLPDRYVEGTCPHCGYERARGDQCESCTKVLDPVDLINPRSAISGSEEIEIRPSKHLFLKQSTMVDTLRTWIGSQKDWPTLVTSIAYKWLDEGLRDRSITRDLSWGVPVAYKGDVRKGFEEKVFYVWFDAPIEYIAATAEWSEETGNDWESWWREDKGANDVKYVQFMGKDNVPFHTVGFPVTLFGSDEPWKKTDYIKGLNWLNYYGGKFSTSSRRGIFMDQAIELLPSDYWRWYLMANAPESQDTSFTWEQFQSTVNKDLADVLGNLLSRVLKFCASKMDATIPSVTEYGELENETTRVLEEKLVRYTKFMDEMEFRKATAELRSMWVTANEYLQQAAPWSTIKEDISKAEISIKYAIDLIKIFASLSSPFIPNASKTMLELLGEKPEFTWPETFKDALGQTKAGEKITTPDILFKKIEDEQVEEWITQFGGE